MPTPAKIFLSRRNLLTLLAKLDRKAKGEATACTIIKHDNSHAQFPQTMKSIAVTAVEDHEYYTDRPAGEMHPIDEDTLTQMGAVPQTDIEFANISKGIRKQNEDMAQNPHLYPYYPVPVRSHNPERLIEVMITQYPSERLLSSSPDKFVAIFPVWDEIDAATKMAEAQTWCDVLNRQNQLKAEKK